MPDDVNRDWLLSELRALRDMVETEQEHVAHRFEQVNELRRQVLEERGVFVRHEGLNAVSDRVSRLEQTAVHRDDQERLAERVFALEKHAITRAEFDTAVARVGKLEALGPLVTLIAGVIGASIGAFMVRYFFS